MLKCKKCLLSNRIRCHLLIYFGCCLGLEDEGLYRIVGVNSKVTKLTNMLLGKSVNLYYLSTC